ncbi:MAG: hypothetical protein GTO63_11635, partial [Anaerolineae bacterium]|nr:hypothetical protein [Anaerolineae bacterium]NIN95517.1 hypothetical protein [Anaerolineae bacterium]NIQ78511.1 hypothetical protein [Anaerolineae bacterium]
MVSSAWSSSRGTLARMSNFLWGLFAVGLAITAQICLTRARVFEAGMLYTAAVVLIVYSLRRQPGPTLRSPSLEMGRARAIHRRVGLLMIGLSALLGALGLWQFASRSVPLSAWILYAGSLVLFVAAILLMDGGRSEAAGVQPWSRTKVVLLLSLLVLAALLRLWDLNRLPFGTWYDEAQNGLEALRILEDPTDRPVYFPRINSPGHYVQAVATSIRLLGANTEAVRTVSALMGVGAVGAAYLTGRELFGRRMGFVLALLIAVSRWHVNFSRIGMHYVSTPLFELLALGFLLRGLRRQRLCYFAWSGLALGLGMASYAAFLAFPLVLVFLLLHIFVVERQLLVRSWRGLLVLVLATVLTVAPVAQYALREPDEFWGRARKVSVFTGKTREQAFEAVKESAWKHLLMFNFEGDRRGRHNLPGEPMLDPVSGGLMVLGIAVCLWRGRRPYSLLLPVWMGVMLCPGIFSLEWEAPQALRAIGSLPPAYLLAVVPIDGLWREWERGMGFRYGRHFALLLLLLLAQIGYTNYHIYFQRQAQDSGAWGDFSTPETITARIMAQLGDSVEFYVTCYYHGHPTVRFLAPGVTEYHSIKTHDALPLPRVEDRDAVLILGTERRHLYTEAQRYWPRGAFQLYKAPLDGPPVLYVVRLTQDDLAGLRGLIGEYRRGNDWEAVSTFMRQDAQLSFDWRDGDPLALPFVAEWKGTLNAPEYGAYRLFLRTPGDAELYLDETLLLEGRGELSAGVDLAKGNHSLRVRVVGAEGHFELAWQPPGEEEQTVPSWAFYVPPVTSNGLLGKYFA